MKKLTITTKREIPDKYWEEYKQQMSFMGINFEKLEKEGKFEMKKHKPSEKVITIYELK